MKIVDPDKYFRYKEKIYNGYSISREEENELKHLYMWWVKRHTQLGDKEQVELRQKEMKKMANKLDQNRRNRGLPCSVKKKRYRQFKEHYAE